MKKETIELLRSLSEQYEKSEFIPEDPVQFPRRFSAQRDIEIVGFIASWLAYGNRKAILDTCQRLISKEFSQMSPYMYISNGAWKHYTNDTTPLYRFFTYGDFAVLCAALKKIYDDYETMEKAVLSRYVNKGLGTDYLEALISLFPGVKGVPQDLKSACKRLNMFLRWMARRNSPVDMGIWRNFYNRDLLIPVDTHVARVARQLGLIKAKRDNMRTVLELTTQCREVFFYDPCKCDFALFGYGVTHKNDKDEE